MRPARDLREASGYPELADDGVEVLWTSSDSCKGSVGNGELDAIVNQSESLELVYRKLAAGPSRTANDFSAASSMTSILMRGIEMPFGSQLTPSAAWCRALARVPSVYDGQASCRDISCESSEPTAPNRFRMLQAYLREHQIDFGNLSGFSRNCSRRGSTENYDRETRRNWPSGEEVCERQDQLDEDDVVYTYGSISKNLSAVMKDKYFENSDANLRTLNEFCVEQVFEHTTNSEQMLSNSQSAEVNASCICMQRCHSPADISMDHVHVEDSDGHFPISSESFNAQAVESSSSTVQAPSVVNSDEHEDAEIEKVSSRIPKNGPVDNFQIAGEHSTVLALCRQECAFLSQSLRKYVDDLKAERTARRTQLESIVNQSNSNSVCEKTSFNRFESETSNQVVQDKLRYSETKVGTFSTHIASHSDNLNSTNQILCHTEDKMRSIQRLAMLIRQISVQKEMANARRHSHTSSTMLNSSSSSEQRKPHGWDDKDINNYEGTNRDENSTEKHLLVTSAMAALQMRYSNRNLLPVNDDVHNVGSENGGGCNVDCSQNVSSLYPTKNVDSTCIRKPSKLNRLMSGEKVEPMSRKSTTIIPTPDVNPDISSHKPERETSKASKQIITNLPDRKQKSRSTHSSNTQWSPNSKSTHFNELSQNEASEERDEPDDMELKRRYRLELNKVRALRPDGRKEYLESREHSQIANLYTSRVPESRENVARRIRSDQGRYTNQVLPNINKTLVTKELQRLEHRYTAVESSSSEDGPLLENQIGAVSTPRKKMDRKILSSSSSDDGSLAQIHQSIMSKIQPNERKKNILISSSDDDEPLPGKLTCVSLSEERLLQSNKVRECSYSEYDLVQKRKKPVLSSSEDRPLHRKNIVEYSSSDDGPLNENKGLACTSSEEGSLKEKKTIACSSSEGGPLEENKLLACSSSEDGALQEKKTLVCSSSEDGPLKGNKALACSSSEDGSLQEKKTLACSSSEDDQLHEKELLSYSLSEDGSPRKNMTLGNFSPEKRSTSQLPDRSISEEKCMQETEHAPKILVCSSIEDTPLKDGKILICSISTDESLGESKIVISSSSDDELRGKTTTSKSFSQCSTLVKNQTTSNIERKTTLEKCNQEPPFSFCEADQLTENRKTAVLETQTNIRRNEWDHKPLGTCSSENSSARQRPGIAKRSAQQKRSESKSFVLPNSVKWPLRDKERSASNSKTKHESKVRLLHAPSSNTTEAYTGEDASMKVSKPTDAVSKRRSGSEKSRKPDQIPATRYDSKVTVLCAPNFKVNDASTDEDVSVKVSKTTQSVSKRDSTHKKNSTSGKTDSADKTVVSAPYEDATLGANKTEKTSKRKSDRDGSSKKEKSKHKHRKSDKHSSARLGLDISPSTLRFQLIEKGMQRLENQLGMGHLQSVVADTAELHGFQFENNQLSSKPSTSSNASYPDVFRSMIEEARLEVQKEKEQMSALNDSP